MIIVDRELRRAEEEGRPIRLALVGVGAIGHAVAFQVLTVTPGIQLVALCNRTVEKAEQAYRDAGVSDIARVDSVPALERAIMDGRPAVTDDPRLVCEAEGIDAVYEATGTIEHGARVALAAIEHGKHVITMNAELQGTVGPILKRRADEAGVMFTDSDGDQPGVMMNLFRFVEGIGFDPVLIGNMKGLHDPYRNPTTQEEFARKAHLTPHMAASFADGTKVSYEMAIVANATGFRVGTRGMYGPDCGDVHEAQELFDADELLSGGMVDYVVGATPAPGVFILAHNEHPVQKHWMHLYKQGDGPFYTFYRPYHLCHLEAPSSVARAVLLRDATIAPRAGPVVEVVATAKRDLREGETIDPIGYYMTYGQCENSDVVDAQRLLPIGLAEGCRLLRDVPRDQVLSYDDVVVPTGRLADELRAEQNRVFSAVG